MNTTPSAAPSNQLLFLPASCNQEHHKCTDEAKPMQCAHPYLLYRSSAVLVLLDAMTCSLASMAAKSSNRSRSAPPTRAPTPLPQQNPYLNTFSDSLHAGYRSRIRPKMVCAKDLEEFLLGNFKKAPRSHLKSPTKTKRHLHALTTSVPYKHRAGFGDVEHHPRDDPGEEMSEVARVWKIYTEEATKFDSSLAEGWNRGIDVLLVFTGLFSAVLTTFIIQSFQLSIPDAGSTTNALLEKLISLQTGSAQDVPPVTSHSPTSNQVTWVNGLCGCKHIPAISPAPPVSEPDSTN
ncbi:hypothetical protein LshimejAT787_0901380 [Lyophyllum shimeji]|uniref:DUF6535 domain-containing protein n=1 Tax=Lyophyllum shimeji TaxID=47721 RepID=A0A9P3PST0_LYOSH|nr:hypothetical protein LshimejAT787_0901380 [Lyophyllum shimeji]